VNGKIIVFDTAKFFTAPLCGLTTAGWGLVGKTSDLAYTAYTSANIGNVTITPGVISVTVKSRSSAIVGEIATYTVTFTTQSRVPQGKPITIAVPLTQMVYNPAITQC
jgi:hypothetical protein